MSLMEGGCLCGAVRYEVSSKPKRLTVCHCRFCQRATGSAYMAEPIFDRDDLTIIKGAAKTYEHLSEGSGKRVYVHFCDTCGTKLFLSFERFAESIGVYAGTFDDPNWYACAKEDTKHIFLGVAQNGTLIPPGVNTFEAHAMKNDGSPLEPRVYSEPSVVEQN